MGKSVNNLSKSFGKKAILNNFSYEFSDTGIYLLKGESGVGKTTLLRILAGLDKDFDGEIQGFTAENCSVAFQEYRLFPTLSVLDNVLIASPTMSDEDVRRAKDLLTALELSVYTHTFFPSELSGGMKQRVSLARAFLKKCEILLLDEPTKELDTALVGKLLDLIEAQAKDRLIIISTHDLLCDKLNIKGEIRL